MQLYDKTDTFLDDIKPLMEEVGRICKQHTIQFTTCFQVQAKEHGEECHVMGYYLNDADFPSSMRLTLMNTIAQAPEPVVALFAERMGLLK